MERGPAQGELVAEKHRSERSRTITTRNRNKALIESTLDGIKLLGRGKVRDLYEVEDKLLVVASDRISAFDVVLPNGIPEKGKILTQLSVFWFDVLEFPHHLISAELDEMPQQLQPFADQLRGRSMLVKKLEIVPVECVVRGYLAGSGWKEYQESQSICGVQLPAGLVQCDRLPESIFTPTTKATTGHDKPMTFAEVEAEVGGDLAAQLRDRSLEVYTRAAEIATSRGAILTDTKFEWGRGPSGDLVLADEVLTPDSSRFWDVSTYAPGRNNEAYDKQFVRDYLNSLDWDKTPPGPELPDEVVEGTASRYREIYEKLTGNPWK